MIDRLHQGRGIGRRVIELAVDEARAWGARDLLISWCDLPGTAGPLYLDVGFEPTGVNTSGEIEARLTL
jgi:GNAT superfamily N-acetyltransferase